jgi:hypothetical protein
MQKKQRAGLDSAQKNGIMSNRFTTTPLHQKPRGNSP